MSNITEALRFFGRNPGLWRFAALPMLAAVLLFVLLASAGFLAIDSVIPDGSAETPMRLVAAALYVALLVVASGFIFVILMSLVGSFLWDGLSAEVERLVGVRPPNTSLSPALAIGDGLGRFLFAIGWAALGLLAGFVVPMVPGILAAGWVALHDYTASPYLRRGILFREQRQKVRHLPGAAGFALVAGLISLLPLINALCAPILVVAGTLLVLKGTGERQSA